MSKQITMRFWRDKYEGPGCLEYSWVPEGRRHYINLLPGIQQGSSTDTIDDTLNPSNVQVYVATNNGEVSRNVAVPVCGNEDYPYSIGACLAIRRSKADRRDRLYADDTVTSELAKLDPHGRVCPQRPAK